MVTVIRCPRTARERPAEALFVFVGNARLDSLAPPVFYKPMLFRGVAFPDFCEPCLPSQSAKPPAGAGWLHEIKHDGFRMLVRRDAAGVRLFTRNGHDWTGRFPLIARAADLHVAFAEYWTALRKVGISYSCCRYEEGKKIGLRDAVRALYCIVPYNLFSPAAKKMPDEQCRK
jgi:hypothetical protein